MNLEFNKTKNNSKIENKDINRLDFSSESDENYNEENSGYTINYNQNTVTSPKKTSTNNTYNNKSSYENIFTQSNNSQGGLDEIAKNNIDSISLRNNLSYFKCRICIISNYIIFL